MAGDIEKSPAGGGGAEASPDAEIGPDTKPGLDGTLVPAAPMTSTDPEPTGAGSTGDDQNEDG